MDYEVTAEEKQRLIEKHNKSQKRLYMRGKIIVYIIAIINLVDTVITAFTNFNLIVLIISLALTIALLCGVTWVKYFYAITYTLCYIIYLYALSSKELQLMEDGSNKTTLIVRLVILTCYTIVTSIVLFKSKAVSEYMYAKRSA